MKKSWMIGATAVSVLSAMLISGNSGARPLPAAFNITVTVYDADTNGAPTHIASDDYNGNGQAVYNSVNDPNTTTTVWAGTNMFLDLFNQSNRTLYINADDPLPGSPSGPAPGKYWQNVEFYTGCYDANKNLILLESITTSNGNCRVGVDFTSSGVKYKLDMGPVQPTTGPPTGWAYVQCNLVSAGKCVNWTVTPNLNGPTPMVGNLYYYSTKPSRLIFLHQYYDTYRIGFTNP